MSVLLKLQTKHEVTLFMLEKILCERIYTYFDNISSNNKEKVGILN